MGEGTLKCGCSILQSKSNTTVEGKLYLVKAELGNDKALTKTIYEFDCRNQDFKNWIMPKDLTDKDGSKCTKCFGTEIE